MRMRALEQCMRMRVHAYVYACMRMRALEQCNAYAYAYVHAYVYAYACVCGLSSMQCTRAHRRARVSGEHECEDAPVKTMWSAFALG